jgi:hypothetical protein
VLRGLDDRAAVGILGVLLERVSELRLEQLDLGVE